MARDTPPVEPFTTPKGRTFTPEHIQAIGGGMTTDSLNATRTILVKHADQLDSIMDVLRFSPEQLAETLKGTKTRAGYAIDALHNHRPALARYKDHRALTISELATVLKRYVHMAEQLRGDTAFDLAVTTLIKDNPAAPPPTLSPPAAPPPPAASPRVSEVAVSKQHKFVTKDITRYYKAYQVKDVTEDGMVNAVFATIGKNAPGLERWLKITRMTPTEATSIFVRAGSKAPQVIEAMASEPVLAAVQRIRETTEWGGKLFTNIFLPSKENLAADVAELDACLPMIKEMVAKSSGIDETAAGLLAGKLSTRKSVGKKEASITDIVTERHERFVQSRRAGTAIPPGAGGAVVDRSPAATKDDKQKE